MKSRSLAGLFLLAATVSCGGNGTSAPIPAAPTPQPGVGGATATRPPVSPPTSTTSGQGGQTSAPATPPQANAPQGGPPGGGRGGAPGGGPPGGFQGGGRGPQMTPEQRAARRDSLTADRALVVAELTKRITGYENRRAEEEFTNVQLMKDTTASNLLKTMDYYGKSLGVGCTFCHVAGGKWDEDSKDEKKTTRVMINLVNLINTQGLSKLEPGRNGQTPKISCVTCHRGNSRPGQALLP